MTPGSETCNHPAFASIEEYDEAIELFQSVLSGEIGSVTLTRMRHDRCDSPGGSHGERHGETDRSLSLP